MSSSPLKLSVRVAEGAARALVCSWRGHAWRRVSMVLQDGSRTWWAERCTRCGLVQRLELAGGLEPGGRLPAPPLEGVWL